MRRQRAKGAAERLELLSTLLTLQLRDVKVPDAEPFNLPKIVCPVAAILQISSILTFRFFNSSSVTIFNRTSLPYNFRSFFCSFALDEVDQMRKRRAFGQGGGKSQTDTCKHFTSRSASVEFSCLAQCLCSLYCTREPACIPSSLILSKQRRRTTRIGGSQRKTLCNSFVGLLRTSLG